MNKVYFRYHRGTLSESLATQFEIDNWHNLVYNIKKDSFIFAEDDNIDYKKYDVLEFDHYDSRCNQYLWIVTSENGVIGFICYDKPELPEGFDK